MDLKKCGQLIAEKRRAHNLTQKQLGDKVGVSDKAVSKWERGLSFPDIGIVEDLADALGLSLSELLSGEKNDVHREQVENLLTDTLFLSKQELKRRRRRQLMIAVVVLAILIPLVSLWAFVVQPVDGTGKTDSVNAQAFPSGNVLSLPLKTRVNPGDFYAFGDMYFNVRFTVPEMEEKLVSLFGEENVTDFGRCILVEKTAEPGKTDFYMLSFLGFSDGKKRYVWTGMRMGLGNGDDIADNIVIPLHLFDDSRICQRDTVQLVCGAEYEVCEYLYNYDTVPFAEQLVSLQVFKDFYEKCGWFDVILEENVLTVLPKAECPMQNGFTVTLLTHSQRNYCTFNWLS